MRSTTSCAVIVLALFAPTTVRPGPGAGNKGRLAVWIDIHPSIYPAGKYDDDAIVAHMRAVGFVATKQGMDKHTHTQRLALSADGKRLELASDGQLQSALTCGYSGINWFCTVELTGPDTTTKLDGVPRILRLRDRDVIVVGSSDYEGGGFLSLQVLSPVLGALCGLKGSGDGKKFAAKEKLYEQFFAKPHEHLTWQSDGRCQFN